MKLSQLPNELRILADRIESSDISDCCVGLELTVDTIEDRDELRKWSAFFGNTLEVVSGGKVNMLRNYNWRRGVTIGACVFFKPGLLGGKIKTIAEDDAEGLAQLMAESPVAVG